jgi:hypothetical protein
LDAVVFELLNFKKAGEEGRKPARNEMEGSPGAIN